MFEFIKSASKAGIFAKVLVNDLKNLPPLPKVLDSFTGEKGKGLTFGAICLRDVQDFFKKVNLFLQNADDSDKGSGKMRNFWTRRDVWTIFRHDMALRGLCLLGWKATDDQSTAF